MAKFNNSDTGAIIINGREVGCIMLNGAEVWTAGNFRTADNCTLKTSDNKTFNVKE